MSRRDSNCGFRLQERQVTIGDQLIVVVQFDDLKDKIKKALTDEGILSLEIMRNTRKLIKAEEPFQKRKLRTNGPRVLLLKMNDEQSAGLNLTNLNTRSVSTLGWHQQNNGRIRRFGQTTNSIDTYRYGDLWIEREQKAELSMVARAVLRQYTYCVSIGSAESMARDSM